MKLLTLFIIISIVLVAGASKNRKNNRGQKVDWAEETSRLKALTPEAQGVAILSSKSKAQSRRILPKAIVIEDEDLKVEGKQGRRRRSKGQREKLKSPEKSLKKRFMGWVRRKKEKPEAELDVAESLPEKKVEVVGVTRATTIEDQPVKTKANRTRKPNKSIRKRLVGKWKGMEEMVQIEGSPLKIEGVGPMEVENEAVEVDREEVDEVMKAASEGRISNENEEPFRFHNISETDLNYVHKLIDRLDDAGIYRLWRHGEYLRKVREALGKEEKEISGDVWEVERQVKDFSSESDYIMDTIDSYTAKLLGKLEGEPMVLSDQKGKE